MALHVKRPRVDRLDPRTKLRIRKDLLRWYRKFGRTFPWRKKVTPYRVLIAEKLLQQTRATQLIVEVYDRFLKKYPSPEILSKASVVKLRAMLRPLGFHYRAKQLKKMGSEIVDRFKSQVPANYDDLKSLTGIGEYCSNAVICFAFKKRVAIVDTNVARFLYRLNGRFNAPYKNPSRSKQVYGLAWSLLPRRNFREFNYAILDICSSICISQNPRCEICPLNKDCIYGKQRLNRNVI